MATRPAVLLPLLTQAPSPAVDGSATDRDLLRRFARDRDEAAFAVLVRRHGPMVQGVCRRVLGNPADADDAAQATFLVLARKAGSTRWRPSVASWLYATARQVALNARTARARRVKHEGRAGVKPPASPLAEISGEELLAILDEELGRLPERYRAPVVLCCVEGLTRDEAAIQLGVPAATLKGQLERGRKRLHDVLARRGVALGAGLLVLLATRPAGATSPRLVQAVRAAVAGKAPPAVVALAEAGAVNGLAKKIVAGLVLAAATAVVGFGLGQPRPTSAGPAPDKEMPARGSKADSPPAKSKAELKVPEAKGPAVTGRVRSADGKPLAGAELLLVGKGDQAAELGTTGTDGKFNVRLPADWKGGYLVARSGGVGIDFAQLGDTEPKGDIELKVVADVAVRGRVVDTEGKPVAGAAVRVERVGTSAANSLDPILAEWRKQTGYSASPAGEKTIWAGAAALWGTTTDRDGRFEFRGLGAERLAVLRLSGGGVTDAEAYVATRKGLDPKEFNDAVVKNAGGKPRWCLYGPDFTVVAEREKLIRGRVADVDTGKPRADVEVLLTRTDGGDLLQVIPRARTDKDGRYEMHGVRKAKSYMVEVAADAAAGYMPAQATAGDTPGYDPLAIDLRVRKGVVVTGRIIDKGTGKPVAGWALIGVPQGNPSVKDYPEFNSSAWFPMQRTDAEGRFRVVAIPGPVLLFGQPENADFMKYKPPVADPKYPQFFKVFGDHTAYYMPGGGFTPLQGRACKVLEVKAGETMVEQDIELVPVDPTKKPVDAKPDPAMPARPAPPPAKMEKKPASNDKPEAVEVTGRVVGPDDKPVAGATVQVVPWAGRGARFDPPAAPVPAGADGKYDVRVPTSRLTDRQSGEEVSPLVLATAPGHFPGWTTGPANGNIVLAPAGVTITGRVTDLEGKPVAGATVRVAAVAAPAGPSLDAWVDVLRRDRQAAVSAGTLGPRIAAELLTGPATSARTDATGRFELAGYAKDRVVHATITGPNIATFTAGLVTRDLGPEPLPGPSGMVYRGTGGLIAAKPSRPITGVVRDRDTRTPVAEATIQSLVMAGRSQLESGLVTTTSDRDGKFALAGMPKGSGNVLLVVPGRGQPYLVRGVEVPDPGGFDPVVVDVALERGILIEGVVRDPAGRPIPNVSVAYLANRFNDRALRQAYGGRSGGADPTDADGKFRVVGLPGTGYLVALGPGRGYLAATERAGNGSSDTVQLDTVSYSARADQFHAVYAIDVPRTATGFRQDVTLERGTDVTVVVVDPDGTPVTGCRSLWARPGDDWREEVRPGEHRVEAINSKHPRTVLFRHADRNLVGVWSSTAGEQRLTLRPGVTLAGRVLTDDGRSRAGASVSVFVRPSPENSGDASRYRHPGERVVTGADGRFRVPALAPGFTYEVSLDGQFVANSTFELAPKATGAKDLGDLRLRVAGE
jgi:RNA polymerase sigma factor (sigma-70 family)